MSQPQLAILICVTGDNVHDDGHALGHWVGQFSWPDVEESIEQNHVKAIPRCSAIHATAKIEVRLTHLFLEFVNHL